MTQAHDETWAEHDAGQFQQSPANQSLDVQQLTRDIGSLYIDNPELYYSFFPDPENHAGRFALGILRRYGAGTKVLDVGSGTGRTVAYLCDHEYTAVGFDLSKHMIDSARKRYPQLRFIQGDMRQFDLGERFDALLCTHSTFIFNRTNEELVDTLTAFNRHLVPGGLLLLDVSSGVHYIGNERYFSMDHPQDVVVDGQVIRTVSRFHFDRAQQLMCRTLFWFFSNQAEPLVEHFTWRMLFPQEMRFFLTQTGFEVCDIFDAPGARGEQIWTCDDMPLNKTMEGVRMHVVARASQNRRCLEKEA